MWKWIILAIVGQTAPEQSVYYDNIVVVVDASGSMSYNMSGTKIAKLSFAKSALQTVLAQVGDTTQIGIVVFGKVPNEWVYNLGTKDNAKLKAAIDSIECGGGTPLGTYIKRGADVLVQQRQKQMGYGSYRLLIITDGEADGGTESSYMSSYTTEIIRRGITVDVIGVDMKQDHALAAMVGTRYRTANAPETLTSAMKEVFSEINRQDANAKADFDLVQGLDPQLTGSIIRTLSQSQNHPIGDKPPKLEKPVVLSSEAPEINQETNMRFISVAIGGVVLIIIFTIRAIMVTRGGY